MAYATLDDLKARLDWDLDGDELRIAAGALEDASTLAAAYGRDWPTDRAPQLVRTLVLKAAARYMSNPGGYTQSRAGDETLAWADLGHDAGTVHFTAEEKRLLEGLAGTRPGLTSVIVSSWDSTIRPGVGGLVPVDYGGDRFPLYCDDRGPW
ncbi:hypothetical protein LKL35_26215 [Streptomyces sp. ET3-23]|uniref:hypothetical protein n=1 Tax=Streptomyces sp. ET3-23 TaxID=2885643 RepID=UPI001D12692E|nr:hypothetical protein [Streptomyces sp. ET3-23]MCC2278895.1 hypothetical protein [Streptomyces sp. ET3-23]